ncbi:hypothetical protein H3U87_05495 [Bifidobacterium sp. W8101]|uniref:hypothetical protein n=1 Tax=Bifidobacterium TaxID=1678 RepID=UPI0018DCDDD4|nr:MULTISPECIES: hypothetical protein [Bifidobacterium]MBI0126581.1 hypothetical protein [Bifidobacterium choladohabitans]MBI0128150.1 hypothetical protein [Bifidobacterium sp. W8103]
MYDNDYVTGYSKSYTIRRDRASSRLAKMPITTGSALDFSLSLQRFMDIQKIATPFGQTVVSAFDVIAYPARLRNRLLFVRR